MSYVFIQSNTTTSHCGSRRSSGQQGSGEVTDFIKNPLVLKTHIQFSPLGGRTESESIIYIWCKKKKSAGCRKSGKCLRWDSGLQFSRRPAVALWGFFGSSAEPRSRVLPADGKSLYITGSDSRITSQQKNVGQKNKQLLALWQKHKQTTKTCWNAKPAIESVNKQKKHFALWENFSPLCTLKASSAAKCWWLRCFLAVRLNAQWFYLLSRRKVTH